MNLLHHRVKEVSRFVLRGGFLLWEYSVKQSHAMKHSTTSQQIVALLAKLNEADRVRLLQFTQALIEQGTELCLSQNSTTQIMSKTAPTLAQQIDALQIEVAEFISELEKQQTALDQLLNFKVSPQNNTPEEVSRALIKTAEQRAKNQTQADALRQAIHELQRELQTRREALTLLQQQQSEQLKKEKMEAARTAVQNHIERINSAAAHLEAELWELKATWQEHNTAFKQGQRNPYEGMGYGYKWQPNELVVFRGATVSELVETEQGFILQSRNIDLLKSERIARQQAELEEKRQTQLKLEARRQQEQRSRLQSRMELLEKEARSLQSKLSASGGAGTINDYRTKQRLQADLQRVQNELSQCQQLLAGLDSAMLEPAN